MTARFVAAVTLLVGIALIALPRAQQQAGGANQPGTR